MVEPDWGKTITLLWVKPDWGETHSCWRACSAGRDSEDDLALRWLAPPMKSPPSDSHCPSVPPPLASPPSKHLGNNLVITMYVLCNYVINWISNDKIETWKEKKLKTRWPLHSGHLWPSWGLLKYVLFVQYHVPLNNKLFHCHCHCHCLERKVVGLKTITS